MSRDALVTAIVEAARRLPPSQLAALAEAVEAYGKPTGAITEAVPSPHFRDIAGRLAAAWAGASTTGSALALGLRATGAAIEQERGEQSIEVVWTGPKTTAVPVRLTREVLIDVIRAARQSLFVVSFAAYKVDVVLHELAAAADRGVAIRLILESGETDGGTLTFAAAKAFERLKDRVMFYVWPLDKRPPLEKGRASLHAKAAIADDRAALVTSANLTGHAMTENMELGLLLRGGSIPGRLSDHFHELIAKGVLVQAL